MISASKTRAIVVRRLGPQLRRAAQLFAARLPPLVQRFAGKTFAPIAARWPLLAHLAGIAAGADERSAAPAPPGLGREARARRLVELASSSDFVARARAAEALAAAHDPTTTEALVAALRDPSAEVACAAAEALRGRAEFAVAEALTEVVENRSGYFSPAARVAAVRALGSVLLPGNAAVLATSLADPDAEVSLAAIGALVERGDETSAGPLFRVLEDRTGFFLPLTRRAAARGLSRLRAPETEGGRVRAVLADETDAAVAEELSALLLLS